MKAKEIREIRLEDLDTEAFIRERVEAISSAVGEGIAINALSGGVLAPLWLDRRPA